MTLITFQDGKPVLRDGQVGTEQACCCGGCSCGECALAVVVNGVRVNTVVVGSASLETECAGTGCSGSPSWFNPAETDQSGWTLVECGTPPAYQTACEDAFELCDGYSCNPLAQDGFETLISSCNYRARACLYCTESGITARVYFYSLFYYGCRFCDGTGGYTNAGRLWYADYTLDALPSCNGESSMTAGEDVELFPDECEYFGILSVCEAWDAAWTDRMCGCGVSVSLSCANPLP
jgi:hypothetical protein